MTSLSSKSGSKQVFLRTIQSLIAGIALSAASSMSYGQVMFTDDFSSGDLTKTQNGFQWLDMTNTKVVTFSGSKALEFTYSATSAGQDGWSEQRFALGNYYRDVWVKYDIYVPSNYTLRELVNEKSYLTLWTDSYTGAPGVAGGFQHFGNPNGSDYLMFQDWSAAKSVAHIRDETRKPAAFSAHKGKWANIIMQMKAGTGSGDAVIKLWVDNNLVFDISPGNPNPYISMTTLLYQAGANNRFNFGYLLGWSNNGFNQTTRIYIDNFVFSNTPLINSDPPSSPIGQ